MSGRLDEIQYELNGTNGEITELLAKRRGYERELSEMNYQLSQLYEKRKGLILERNQICDEIKQVNELKEIEYGSERTFEFI